MVIIIAPAVPQIPQQPKIENSKPPLLYLLQDLRRNGNQIFKRRLPPNRTKGKRKKQCTHIEDTRRLATEEVEMLQIVLYLVIRKRSKVVG